MKRYKKVIFTVVALFVVGTASIAYGASGARTPAEVISSLTEKSVEQLYEEREEGKTFGTIAKEAGKLDEFKSEMLKEKKAILDERVENGELTQERADTIYNSIKENQVDCDGTGSQGIGKENGQRFGGGKGNGMGRRSGSGRGMGNGRGCR